MEEPVMNSNIRNLPTVASLVGMLFALVVLASPAHAGSPGNEEAMQARGSALRDGSLRSSHASHGSSRADDCHHTDCLYIGDGTGSNAVKRFNAKTGEYLGEFVTSGSGGLLGPRGLMFAKGKLYVVNQNVDQELNGEILRYRRKTGDFVDKLVAADDEYAPFAPRGLVRGPGRTVYLANYVPNIEYNGPGWIRQFDAETGEFLGGLDSSPFGADFWPRGIVFGPDGLLYVSVTGNLFVGDRLPGYVLRFNPHSGKFVDVFASSESSSAVGCAKDLHRPEGLVFGPDNKLYVTSFRADPSDTDKILIFNRKTGACVDKIDLAKSEASGGTRAFAQAILFGPKGRLFVSMFNTGEVRRYNVRTKEFEVFVPCSGDDCALKEPWYMTFEQTDPATLEYDD
jgi:DNA-binding beta-propeller fold protein YncE